MIFNKNKLNARRLGYKEVKELLKGQVTLNESLTNEFALLNDSELGHPKLYDLDGNILYVHSCPLISGKGDIYSVDEINRVLEEYKYKRAVFNKTSMLPRDVYGRIRWDVFSENSSNMINMIPTLISALAVYVGEPIIKLNKSYASLDIISEKVNRGDSYDNIVNNYDSIFVYIGEVLKEGTTGKWSLSDPDQIPYIRTDYRRVAYNPINIIGESMNVHSKVDFRRLTMDEYKKSSKRLECVKKYDVKNKT